MSSSYTLSIRGCESVERDARFIGDAFDSAIAHLPTIGSGGQWGARTSSELPESSTNATIAAAEASLIHQQLSPLPASSGGRGLFDVERADIPHARILIAEATRSIVSTAHNDGRVEGGREEKEKIPVAAVIYQDFVPLNLVNSEEFAPQAREIQERGNFIYLFALLSNFSAGEEARKGSGQALVRETVEIAKRHGYDVVYVDCWSGNGRKLVKYYEKQGFKMVKDFLFSKPDGTEWPGTLLSMELR